jgi:2-(1,2-epoxy-1,2-dihydrophenyl)acetyl-CoA isomerase
MLGDRISAEEGAGIGLVNMAVPKAKLYEETVAFAKRLADGLPYSKIGEGSVKCLSQVPLNKGLKLEAEAFGIVLSIMEGISAFMSKRKTEFEGK